VETNYDRHLAGLIKFAVAPANQVNAHICGQVLASSTASPQVTADDFRACDGFDVMPQVATISAPVLVLSAIHDTLTPVKYADWLAANIGGARHVCIKGAGHMSPIERPVTFNQAISDFLASLD
jgi:pimeloyl-ACP methyl ester carboxylesterase